MRTQSSALVALGFFALMAQAEVVNIDNAELVRLAAKGVPVIDIRTEGEWKNTGVIAGSKLLTFFDERGQANPGPWLERARRIAAPDQPVILVCRSGNRTRAASQYLSEQAGYKTVYNLSKGMNAWLGDARRTIQPEAAMAVCALGAAC